MSKPPVGPDVRAAICTLIDDDAEVTSWLNGSNDEGIIYDKDIGAHFFRGEFSDMCIRVNIDDVTPRKMYESECAEYDAGITIYVFSAGGSDAMPADLMGYVEEAIKGKSKSLVVAGGRTIFVRDIHFVGRAGLQPFLGMWRIPSSFTATAKYV